MLYLQDYTEMHGQQNIKLIKYIVAGSKSLVKKVQENFIFC